MPFAPKTQAPGDLVPSRDWNEAMAEITRLEKDKLNRAGGTVNGNLAVSGELGASNLFGGARFRAVAGRTAADGTDWQVYSSTGIMVDVDASKAGFTATPYYFVSLHGIASHWSTTGGTSIYQPTKTGFRVYLRWADGAALAPAMAQQNKWHLQWLGVQVDELMMMTSMVMLPMFVIANPG